MDEAGVHKHPRLDAPIQARTVYRVVYHRQIRDRSVMRVIYADGVPNWMRGWRLIRGKFPVNQFVINCSYYTSGSILSIKIVSIILLSTRINIHPRTGMYQTLK